MIIGIALVVSELNKGPRLVVRYPPSVPSNIINTTPYLLEYHRQYFSLTPENFAKLFRPKAALFNKISMLTIDDLQYVSFPCPCAEELSSEAGSHSHSDVITLFNVVIATIRDSAMRKLRENRLIPSREFPSDGQATTKSSQLADYPGFDPVAAALGLAGQVVHVDSIKQVVESYSRALLHEEKKNRYVSRQIAAMIRIIESASISSSISTCTSISTSSSVSISTSASTSAAASMSGTAASITSSSNSTPISTGAGIGSITNTSSDVVAERGSLTPGGIASLSSENSVVACATSTSGDGAESDRMDADLKLMESILQQSSLANELRCIYHGLTGGHSINLSVNGVLTLNIKLSSSSYVPSSVAAGVTYGNESNHSQTRSRHNHSGHNTGRLRRASSDDMDSSGRCLRSDRSDSFDVSIGRLSLRNNSSSNSALNSSGRLLKPYQTLLCIGDLDMMLILIANLEASGRNNSSNPVLSHTVNHGPPFSTPSSSSAKTGPASGVQLQVQSGPTGSPTNQTKASIAYPATPFNRNSNASIDVATSSTQSLATLLASTTNPKILEFLTLCDPTSTLADISMAMEEPLSEVFRIALHLEEWGLARRISAITGGSLYHIHPTATIERHGRVFRSFAAAFILNDKANVAELDYLNPTADIIAKILSTFNGSRSLTEAIDLFPSNLKEYAVDIVVWLLRWEMIVEVNSYLCWIPSTNGIRNSVSNANIRETTTLPEATGFSAPKDYFEESMLVGELSQSLTPQEASILNAIQPYLDGTFTISDISWESGFSQSEICSLTETLAQYLKIYRCI